jgi:3-deoxy-manno-octulosonate cytidylyltransferase (CMP-KDO synthetase)
MNVMMTSKECLTGTDRVAEVSTKRNADYYVNVQGDEPLINPKDIQKVIKSIYSSKGDIVNGYAEIKEKREYFSLTIPKVVFREDERLLYMSRSPIPGNKKGSFEKAYRQICIYAFPKDALNDFAQRKVKTRFEETEDIEILRFLEIGHEVQMVKLSEDSIAVDTKEDLERVIAIIEKENS